MDGTGITRRQALLLLALAAAGLLAGWRLFYFFTDDAYIAFRYVANQLAGHGLVWNPEPFRPVEGYTSLLWVLLLGGVWAGLGVEPPDAANLLSLGFGAATLALAWRLFSRMPLPPGLAARRALLFGFVLAGTLSNRTFLAWLSSGLETAMFGCWVTWFAVEAVRFAEEPGGGEGAGRGSRLALAAALAALTRPEGALLAAGAVALLAGDAALQRRGSRLLAGWPLLVLPLHLAWRRLSYGEWLPNTYYAKYLEPWPESGARYAASFVVEYGLWVWLALAGVYLVRSAPHARVAALWRARGALVVLGVLGFHWLYYTFAIGGDHFEYRIYSHLVPLLWVSGVWLATRIWSRPAPVLALLGVWLAASLPIPWVHWNATRGLDTRTATVGLFVPIAARFPAPLRPLVGRWDAWQGWLIGHNVGLRHQEHKIFHRHRIAILPPRAEGLRMDWSELNVFAEGGVGVLGWVMPHLAVIDIFGLNDYVVARLPPPPRPEGRQMAHDRLAPAAYLRCFRPNVSFVYGERRMEVRPRELSPRRVRECETRDWTWAARRQYGSGADASR